MKTKNSSGTYKEGSMKERKAPVYGGMPAMKVSGQVSKVRSNNQCKKCQTGDARDTKYK
jgi:hypothetical protein